MPNKFNSQYGIDENALPDSAQKLEQSALIHRTLEDSGYINIGIDHFVLAKELPFAQPDSEATRRAHLLNMPHDLLGLGVSAISHIGDYFLQNEKSLESYYHRIALGEMPIARGLKISEDDKIRRFIILSLSIHLRLEFAELNSRFGINFLQDFAGELLSLRDMHNKGLIEITEHGIIITASGKPFLRDICTYFDAHLNRHLSANLACKKTPPMAEN